MVKALQNAGAELLLGTDNAVSVHQELKLLVDAGLTPYQALAAGTRNVAKYFGTLDSSGTVTVGKWADLVLVSDNPLENVLHTGDVIGVMFGGRWLDQATFDEQKRASRAARHPR